MQVNWSFYANEKRKEHSVEDWQPKKLSFYLLIHYFSYIKYLKFSITQRSNH